jgi:hypothetical protein
MLDARPASAMMPAQSSAGTAIRGAARGVDEESDDDGLAQRLAEDCADMHHAEIASCKISRASPEFRYRPRLISRMT